MSVAISTNPCGGGGNKGRGRSIRIGLKYYFSIPCVGMMQFSDLLSHLLQRTFVYLVDF